MSLPTSRLAKLAISGMPPTPSSTARHSPTRDDPVSSSDESSGSEEGSGEDSDASTSGILTSRNTRLRYNTSRLSPTTSTRAHSGLKSPFSIVASSTPSEEYYAFQISETAVVRIGAPGTDFAKVTCHCDDDLKPCRHVFFLLDQIASHTLNAQQKRVVLPLTRDGVPREVLDAFETIRKSGTPLLRKLEGKPSAASHNDGDPEPQRDPQTDAERANHIREILASFSPTETKDEYRMDIFDPIEGQGPLYPKDLDKTLALSMLSNQRVFDHFSKIVPQSHCAVDYFKKKRQKVVSALAAMDGYTATKTISKGLPKPDVAWCASVVEGCVNDIMARLNESSGPPPQTARRGAAQALSQILRDLADHNVDVYNNPVWSQRREQVLDIKERNIFVRFFGYRPENGKKFILDDLWDLADVLKEFQLLIEEAGDAFEDKKVSKPYADKYQRLVGDLRGKGNGRPGRTKSGSKRPGDESGGDNKRMK